MTLDEEPDAPAESMSAPAGGELETMSVAMPLDDSQAGAPSLGMGDGGAAALAAPPGECPNTYTATRLGYAKNGRTVTHVLGEQWCWDGVTGCEVPGSYQVTYAREFRYDGARARYMNRKLSANLFTDLGTTWSDYDGDEIYGDFEMVSGSPVDKRSFEPGIARTENPLTTPVTNYYHGDMLGTTRLMTTSPPPPGTPTPIEPAVYTAFGERLPGSATDRFGYVGAWGYQDTLDSGGAEVFPFLHVGARYYDPSSGRFLQHDPIGIRGGLNVYAYVRSQPTTHVDPLGLIPMDDPRYPPIPRPEFPPPSPRDVQKGAQWTAAACAIVIGGPPAIVIGVIILVLDIVEYVGVLPPAPDSWEDFSDWGGGGAG